MRGNPELQWPNVPRRPVFPGLATFYGKRFSQNTILHFITRYVIKLPRMIYSVPGQSELLKMLPYTIEKGRKLSKCTFNESDQPAHPVFWLEFCRTLFGKRRLEGGQRSFRSDGVHSQADLSLAHIFSRYRWNLFNASRWKMPLWHMWTAEILISMHIRAVIFRHSLFLDIYYSIHWFCKRATKMQISLCECAGL